MHSNQSQPNWVLRGARLLGGVLMASAATLAQAITINVVRPDGTPINVPFRWTLQEDKTFNVRARRDRHPASDAQHAVAAVPPQLHAGGRVGTDRRHDGTAATTTNLSAALFTGKRYFLSVLPNGLPDGSPAFQMAGVPIRPNANGSMPTTVRVVVNPTPVQTAQISVLLLPRQQPDQQLARRASAARSTACAAGTSISTTPAAPTAPRAAASATTHSATRWAQPTCADGNVDRDRHAGPEDRRQRRVPRQEPGARQVHRLCRAAGGQAAAITNARATTRRAANPPLTPWPEDGQFWMQTHTIEGTQGIDAWVKSNEPAYFKEFGPPGHHVVHRFRAELQPPPGARHTAWQPARSSTCT